MKQQIEEIIKRWLKDEEIDRGFYVSYKDLDTVRLDGTFNFEKLLYIMAHKFLRIIDEPIELLKKLREIHEKPKTPVNTIIVHPRTTQEILREEADKIDYKEALLKEIDNYFSNLSYNK